MRSSTRLQAFRDHGVHVLGSFIFGLPTDKPDTFEATAALAQRAGVSFAQFVHAARRFPAPSISGSGRRSRRAAVTVDGVPLSRYWLIPSERAAEDLHAASDDVVGRDPRAARRRRGTRSTACRASGSARRACKSLKARLAFVLLSKLYRQMYANTGIATDSARVARSANRARLLASLARRLFMGSRCPICRSRVPRCARMLPEARQM